ncbi:Probable sucrose utilization protein, partial [Scheffersomyces stipitis CBS 6054]
RSKYSRPCDACAHRKVRCTDNRPCSRCIDYGISCTNTRIRKRSGPKPKIISELPFSNNISTSPKGTSQYLTIFIPIDDLYPFLQFFQTWYYGLWPVLSVGSLITNLTTITDRRSLNKQTSPYYSLGLALCAAISGQFAFLSKSSDLPHMTTTVSASQLARAALNVRETFDHRMKPTEETLLTSFFLYNYYINVKNGTEAAIMYLREAISMVHILGLHDPQAYLQMSSESSHRLKKTYYLLLASERFMCIEDNVPVILDSSVPYPLVEDDEYPELLAGFVEVVKIFAIPDRNFFEKMSIANRRTENVKDYEIFQNFFHLSATSLSEAWVREVDKKIKGITIVDSMSDISKVNLLLSKDWMRSLIWRIAYQNALTSALREKDDCLSLNYPMTIAYQFLSSTSNLPAFAFECNGAGVVVKLLDIANGLGDSMNDLSSMERTYDLSLFENALTSVFCLISKFKTKVTLPVRMYRKIENMVSRWSIPRQFSS